MAVKIPIYESQTQATGQLQAQARPLEQTNAVGVAMERFGAAAAAVGGMVVRDINEARVREADNSVSEAIRAALYDPEKGYLTSTGKDSVDRFKDTESQLRGLSAKFSDGLDDPMQKRMFGEVVQRRIDSALNTVTAHAAQQAKVYNDGQAEARAKNSVQDAIGAFDNPVQFNLYRNTAVIEAQHGRTGAAADLARRAVDSNIHLGVLNNMLASKQVDRAQAYFDAHKADIDAGYHDQVIAKLTAGDITQKSLDLSFRLQSEHKSLGDQEAALKQLYEGDAGYGDRADGTRKGRGWMGEIKRPDGTVMTEIGVGVEIDGKEHEIPLIVPTLTAEQVERLKTMPMNGKVPPDIKAKAVEWARDRMAQGKSPFAGAEESPGGKPAGISAEVYDATMQRLRAEAQRQKVELADYHNMMEGHYQDWILKHPGQPITDYTEGYAWAMQYGRVANMAAFAKSQEAGAEKPDNPELYTDWRFRFATDPFNAAQEFKSTSADLRNKLSPRQYDSLLTLSTSAMSGDAKALDLQRQASVVVKGITSDLKSAGLNPNAKPDTTAAREWQSYTASLWEAIDQAQQRKGSALTPQEARQVGLQLLQEGRLQGSGTFFDDRVRRFQMTDEQRQYPFVATDYTKIPMAERQQVEEWLRSHPTEWRRFGFAQQPGVDPVGSREWKNAVEQLYQTIKEKR